MNRHIVHLAVVCTVSFIAGCSKPPTIEELQYYAATESFPADRFLDTVSVKRALVIVAHDDDDCAMSGTIHGLTRKGWTIEQWCFGSTRVEDGATRHPAALICAGNKVITVEGGFRGTDPADTLKPYIPVPKDRFATFFNRQATIDALVPKVREFNPSVIFTLDNQIGAYGNPEHVFISQLVLDLFRSGELPAHRIYQGVYTDHMEETIIDERLARILEEYGFPNTTTIANELYGVHGMPAPDVQVDIRPDSLGKMDYLMSYSEDARHNLRKFIPYFEDVNAGTYFSVFDREFFRVIARDTTGL